MNTPPYIKKGDKVAVVGTARKISRKEIGPAIEVLEKWGLEVVLGPNLYNEAHQFAGTGAERANDLQTALDNPDIQSILFARGGGMVRFESWMR